MNPYRFLADLVAAVHFAWVAFVVIGMVLILLGIWRRWRWVRNFWFRAVHFLMIALVVAESLGGIICPLTTWEDDLRVKAGEVAAAGRAGEPASFVGRWVHRLLFFDAPPWVFMVCYCVFGAVALAALILAPPRWPSWRRRISAGQS